MIPLFDALVSNNFKIYYRHSLRLTPNIVQYIDDHSNDHGLSICKWWPFDERRFRESLFKERERSFFFAEKFLIIIQTLYEDSLKASSDYPHKSHLI